MHREHTYIERLLGRTIVVFGGSSGAGRELRHAAHRFGAEVFSFSQVTTGTHTRNQEQVRDALGQVRRATGRVDAVVTVLASAGGDHDTITAPDREGVVTTVARLATPHLVSTGGHLLFVAPVTESLRRLVQSLAIEWSSGGVRVSCLANQLSGPEALAMRSLDVLAAHRSTIDPCPAGSAIRRVAGPALFGQEPLQLGTELLRRR